MNAPRNVISASEYRKATMCGEDWHRTYVLGQRGEPTPSLIRGTAVHRAIATNLRRKRDAGALIETREELDATTSDAFDNEIRERGVRFTGADIEVGKEKILGAAKDRAVRFSRLHASALAPKIDPIAVELEVTSAEPIPEIGTHLVGVLDIIDNAGGTEIVRDTKTGARKKTVEQVHGDVGLATYSVLHWMHRGRLPSAVRLDSLVITPAGRDEYVQHDLPSIQKTEPELLATLEGLRRVVAMREAGIVPPPAVTGRDWWCSQRSCPHTADCPFYNRRADASA